jgi:HD superfamily phosphodiesterase
MRISLSELFQFVIAVSAKYKIDESHSLGHSMRVFQFADKIAREEARWTPNPTNFVEQTPIIHAAAILHDTCDKKYRDEEEGLAEVSEFLKPRMPKDQVNATVEIIRYMSYSKVKQCGMPDLGQYQAAFNAVREADLLDAYDFDRSLIYHMMHNKKELKESYENAIALFENRVLKHEDDGLLLTRYAKREHQTLSQVAIMRMYHWRRVLKYAG